MKGGNVITAKNEYIEIRIDLARPEVQVNYRVLDEHIDDSGTWKSTPFQSADFRNENDALEMVNYWLDYSCSH